MFTISAFLANLSHRNTCENFNAAIDAFNATPHNKGQAARALWKKGCLLASMSDATRSSECFEAAMKLRRGLVPEDERPVEELTDQDWTNLIIYWSR